MAESANGELLRLSLLLAVPLRITEYQRRGVGADDWARVRDVADALAHCGDILLYRSETRGDTAALFAQLADALAVLSFAPGGVKVFGLHWETSPPDDREGER